MGKRATAAYLAISFLTVMAWGQAPNGNVKVGEFETTFTERSPLSSPAEIYKRMGEKAPPPVDYNLAAEPFRVYVPQNYDPSIPHGILYFLCYKQVDMVPPKWQPLFDQQHLIFMTTRGLQPEWERMGLALDGVHNLKKLYAINEQRIYLVGEPPTPWTVTQIMGMSVPDVFTGFVYVDSFLNYRKVTVPTSGSSYAPTFAMPPAGPLLTLSKSRLHIVAVDPNSQPKPGEPDRYKLFIDAYKADGFRYVEKLQIPDHEDIHFPNMAAPWLEKAIALLDAPRVEARPTVAGPTTTPATKPSVAASPSEAQRMLSLAKNYIAAKSYANARTRLQDLIARYPNDPAAKEAKQLIEQIKGK